MKKYEILLVDDSPTILTVVGCALEDKGYQVATAASGEAALQTLTIKDFDLVITDLNMSEIDGLIVLKSAKELNPRGAVIILTGNRDTEMAIQALQLDADDYILKPCALTELFERVVNCLERSEPEQRRTRSDLRFHMKEAPLKISNQGFTRPTHYSPLDRDKLTSQPLSSGKK